MPRVVILNRHFFCTDETVAASGFRRGHRNTRPTHSNKGTSGESTSIRREGADKGTSGGSGIHDWTQHVKRRSLRNGGLSVKVPFPALPI